MMATPPVRPTVQYGGVTCGRRSAPSRIRPAVSPTSIPTAASQRSRTDRFKVTLGAAFAASVVIHASALAALILLTGGPVADRTAYRAEPDRNLEVMLAPAHVEDPVTVAAATPTPPEAVNRITDSSDTIAPSRPAPAPTPQETHTKASGAGGPFEPRVVISDSVPRARFGEFLEGDVLAGFALEVDEPARLGQPLVVPYPPGALRERREDTVVLWAVVDAQGHLEKVHFTEGELEFKRAVLRVLAATRLVPAKNDGIAIRHYVTLELQFRIDTPGQDASASNVVTAEPR